MKRTFIRKIIRFITGKAYDDLKRDWEEQNVKIDILTAEKNRMIRKNNELVIDMDILTQELNELRAERDLLLLENKKLKKKPKKKTVKKKKTDK